MTDEPQTAQTPLIELLRSTPLDAVATYEHNPTSHSHIPYGYQAHQAADEIEMLRGEVERARKTNREMNDELRGITELLRWCADWTGDPLTLRNAVLEALGESDD